MEMKSNCEKCSKALEQDGIAYVCSYECTYCEDCTTGMNNVCPNCGGELVRRPKREKKEQ